MDNDIVKLCLKENCDPCPWRRKRERGDGIPLNRSVKRCANMRGCVWEIWHRKATVQATTTDEQS